MKKYTLILGFLLSLNAAFSQGCSDAGICTLGNGFKSEEKSFKNNIEVATIFGAGEADVTYFSPTISYSRKISDHFSLSSKVTFSSANGSFGTRASLGDAFLVGNYLFKENNNKQWSALVGIKIPFTNSNQKNNGFSLPLDYQSSLGTYDLFLGTNLNYKKWDFNAVVQIPVINNNKNSYFDEFSPTNDFPTTNLFERKPDVLLRATYSLKTANSKFVFKPNVLLIYHLGKDTFVNTLNNRQSIVGSDGLTVNGNLISTYNLNTQNSLELSLATPFVVRDIRPDGLTRKFVVGLQYRYSF